MDSWFAIELSIYLVFVALGSFAITCLSARIWMRSALIAALAFGLPLGIVAFVYLVGYLYALAAILVSASFGVAGAVGVAVGLLAKTLLMARRS
jgi:hypothetical protein